MKSAIIKKAPIQAQGAIQNEIEGITFIFEPQVLKLTLYGADLPSKKNNKAIAFNSKTKRPFIISSPEYLKWHKEQSAAILQWKVNNIGKLFEFPITRCRMNVNFFFADNRQRDLDNKVASVLDLLVDAGILKSDAWQVVRPITMDAGISKTTPRCDIYFYPADDSIRRR